jgi:hypothetical protein
MAETLVYLLEVDAWTGQGVETLRYASLTQVTRPSDNPPNTVYDGRISAAGFLERTLFQGGGVVGRPTVGIGAIELNNGDGALDPLIGYGWDGRVFRLKEMAHGGNVSSALTVATGVLAGIDTSSAWTTLRLRLREPMSTLERPLLTARYAGTTTSAGLGVEGDENLQDTIKPYVFGSATNVPPKLVNAFDQAYQVSAGATSSITVYDGGVALIDDGDFPSATGMLGWTQIPGHYVTSLASGLFRLGGDPIFEITADVVEAASAADRSAPRVAQRMLALAGVTNLDTATFDNLHAANPAEVQLFVNDESTILNLVGQVLGSIGAGLVPTDTGSLQAIRGAEEPVGTATASFSLRDITLPTLQLGASATEDGAGVPAWSVVLEYGRVWQVQTVGQLNGVTTQRQALLAAATRKATAQDATIKTAHPLASEITVATLLRFQADAQAEAARLLALLKIRRDRIGFEVSDEVGRVGLGNVVTHLLPRFGLETGKLFRVIGRNDDFSKRRVTLTLWG